MVNTQRPDIYNEGDDFTILDFIHPGETIEQFLFRFIVEPMTDDELAAVFDFFNPPPQRPPPIEIPDEDDWDNLLDDVDDLIAGLSISDGQAEYPENNQNEPESDDDY